MVQTAQASVPDRVTATSAQRERIPTTERTSNTAEHRFTGPRGDNPGSSTRHGGLVHQVVDGSVVLRRQSTRRRLARTDPEAVERKAMRIIGGDGGDGSPSAA